MITSIKIYFTSTSNCSLFLKLFCSKHDRSVQHLRNNRNVVLKLKKVSENDFSFVERQGFTVIDISKVIYCVVSSKR